MSILGSDRLMTRFGTRVERLLDGTRIVLPGQQLDASEQTLIAARCALALRQLLDARAPLVVCTGRAVLGEHQPLGELFERGAALLATTPAGVLRVDEASAALLESRFELGALERSGQTLERERSGGEAPRTVLGQPTPFVGRDRELHQLQLVFDECRDEQVARAVLVTAPAGGGKSRLRHELIERLRAANPQFTLLVGRGDPMRAGTQFSVIASAIQGWAEVAASDSVELQQRKLRARMLALLPSARAEVTVQFIAEMLGIPFPESLVTPQLRAARTDHQLMVDQMLAAWLEWLAAFERRPVLLCVEDLHWADSASLRFIEAALRNSAERGLMVLGRQARFDDALSWLARALRGYEKVASAQFQVEIHAHLTALHCAAGDLIRARESVERGSRMGPPDPGSQAYLLARTSTLERIEGRANDAFAHANRAFELARAHGVQEFWSVAALSYLESALAVGDSSSARMALGEAEKWLEIRAAHIDDPELRRGFLENIPEHKRIREIGATLRRDEFVSHR